MSPPSCLTGPRQRRPKPPPDVLNILASVRRARCTGDLSPAAGLLAWYGWALHLSLSPGKQRSLIEKGCTSSDALHATSQHAASNHGCPTCIELSEQDRRFEAPAWQ